MPKKNPGDLNHRDPFFAPTNQIRFTSERLRIHAYLPYVLPAYQKTLSNTLPELSVISSQLIDLLQLSITPCNSCLHSPNTTLFDPQFDSPAGYSVCTNRCNIGCGIGSLLSMVTSHLLAVPNTESTNCYNLWLACLRHLQPLARHSLSS